MAQTPPGDDRLNRLEQLLAQDPRNPLLLAQVARSALAAGRLGDAMRHVRSGLMPT